MKNNNFLKAEENIQKGWDFVFQKLYYPKTHMIYDFMLGDSVEETVDIFPTPEEIKASVPNPCGWGTGMEDATLNLGTMLEAVENRYKATKDPEMKKYFDMMCEGLIITGTAADEKGFIARCVAPSDGKSVYIDTSRDQYTHWIFAGHIILKSALASEEQKEKIKEVLVDIARKAERDVKPENDGYMLRLDGGKGFVTQMSSPNLGPHELHRLPMMYVAAYEASGDEYWLNKYHEIREELLVKAEKSFNIEWCHNVAKNFGYVYGTYQAQYSFRLLYDIETDEGYKKRYLNLMRTAVSGSKIYIDMAYEHLNIYNAVDPDYRPWRKINAKFFGFLDGYGYYVPCAAEGDEFSEKIEFARRHLRNVGETIVIKNLCPGYSVSDDTKNKFIEIINASNFDTIKNYWPVMQCGAWWGMKANELI